MKNVEKIQEVLSEVQNDVEKVAAGNKSAGTRIRKAMQEIKSLAQTVRVEVQTIKNNESWVRRHYGKSCIKQSSTNR